MIHCSRLWLLQCLFALRDCSAYLPPSLCTCLTQIVLAETLNACNFLQPNQSFCSNRFYVTTKLQNLYQYCDLMSLPMSLLCFLSLRTFTNTRPEVITQDRLQSSCYLGFCRCALQMPREHEVHVFLLVERKKVVVLIKRTPLEMNGQRQRSLG